MAGEDLIKFELLNNIRNDNMLIKLCIHDKLIYTHILKGDFRDESKIRSIFSTVFKKTGLSTTYIYDGEYHSITDLNVTQQNIYDLILQLENKKNALLQYISLNVKNYDVIIDKNIVLRFSTLYKKTDLLSINILWMINDHNIMFRKNTHYHDWVMLHTKNVDNVDNFLKIKNTGNTVSVVWNDDEDKYILIQSSEKIVKMVEENLLKHRQALLEFLNMQYNNSIIF